MSLRGSDGGGEGAIDKPKIHVYLKVTFLFKRHVDLLLLDLKNLDFTNTFSHFSLSVFGIKYLRRECVRRVSPRGFGRRKGKKNGGGEKEEFQSKRRLSARLSHAHTSFFPHSFRGKLSFARVVSLSLLPYILRDRAAWL